MAQAITYHCLETAGTQEAGSGQQELALYHDALLQISFVGAQ